MARIAGIELNDNWRVEYALTRIKGIGWQTSKKILDGLNMDAKTRVKDLTSDDISSITGQLDGIEIEGDLLRKYRENVQRRALSELTEG